MVTTRNIVLLLLSITVVAPIVLYTNRLSTFKYPSAEQEFIEDVAAFAVSAADSGHFILLPTEEIFSITHTYEEIFLCRCIYRLTKFILDNFLLKLKIGNFYSTILKELNGVVYSEDSSNTKNLPQEKERKTQEVQYIIIWTCSVYCENA